MPEGSLDERVRAFSPMITNTLTHLARNYGDDVLEAVFGAFKARREAKVDEAGEEAIDKLAAARDAALSRIDAAAEKRMREIEE